MPAKPISLDEIITEIENWFSESIKRPPIAHDVAAYNQAYAAVEHLKERFVEIVTGKSAPAPTPAAETPAPAAEQPSEPSAPKTDTKPAA